MKFMTINAHAALCVLRYLRGRLASPEAALIGAMLKPGEVAIDVGAHCGSWTIPLSRLPLGRVYAIEALPRYAAVLGRLKSWLRLRNVVIVNGAALATAEPVQLVWQDAAGERLTGLTHVRGIGEASGGTLTVPGLTLDEAVVPADRPRVGLLKLDIEGGELNALRGASRIIAEAHPLIFCEVNESYCQRYGYQGSDLVAFLAQYSYRAYFHGDKGWARVTETRFDRSADILFVPADRNVC